MGVYFISLEKAFYFKFVLVIVLSSLAQTAIFASCSFVVVFCHVSDVYSRSVTTDFPKVCWFTYIFIFLGLIRTEVVLFRL